MALAIAFEDVKATRSSHEKTGGRGSRGRVANTRFLGSRDNPDLPLAILNQHEPGTFNGPHFHTRDQFQVFIEGKGKLGRHDLLPYCVHFTRAYTPYGPLTSDVETGLTFFVMRAHPDAGPQRLPEELDQLKRVSDRQPWQIARVVSFPAFESGAAAADIMLQAVPGISDDAGLAAYTLKMKPCAAAYAPDPSRGDGQFLVVVKGSLLHEKKEHKAPALVFVRPGEGSFRIHAGSDGLETIVLNFPEVKPRAHHVKAASTVPGFKKWQCALCSFTYDEAQGLPDEGILAGTRWEDVPDTWSCPDCAAAKSDFQMVEA